MLSLAAAALCAALLAGPTRVQEFLFPAPRVPESWPELLEEVRAFEQRMDFRATANFQATAGEGGGYTMCGHTSRLTLPYSYEDPAIRWPEITNAQECRAAAGENDVYFTHISAVGEVGTPLTARMIRGKLERFLYLVIHEDCHDQFDFPYGFEEALCNVLAYRGMTAFARERYGAWTRTHYAMRRYANTQTYLTYSVVNYYRQVEQLYARHARGEITALAVLRDRARVFGGAERTFGWHRGTLNNVGLANEMTYSRHFPLIESVHEALGSDLAKTVAFFKSVDRAKPSAQDVLKAERVADRKSAQFVRAYEAAVADAVRRQLALEVGAAAVARLK